MKFASASGLREPCSGVCSCSPVPVSNTLIGLVLLASGSFGLFGSVLGERIVILVFALLGIVGAVLAFALSEAGESEQKGGLIELTPLPLQLAH